jgi:hypothetical protein
VQPLTRLRLPHRPRKRLVRYRPIRNSRAGAEGEGEMTDQSGPPLAGSSPDTAIRLRWVLRDIKAKRTKLSPVSPDDLQTLIGMDLVEMWDEAPLLTNEGERALD